MTEQPDSMCNECNKNPVEIKSKKYGSLCKRCYWIVKGRGLYRERKDKKASKDATGSLFFELSDPLQQKVLITNIQPDRFLNIIEEFIKGGYVTLKEAAPIISEINKSLKIKESEDFLLKDFGGYSKEVVA